MENKLIFKEKKLIKRDSSILGISGENEQEVLIFSFEDGFVDGTCNLELEFPNGNKGFIELEKDVDNECYKLEVKNSLLKDDGVIKMQLKIVQDTAVWKSLEFEMYVLNAINATETIEEDYPDFVTTTTTKLEELEKNKQDKLIEGENITIKNGVISATGGIEVVIGTEEPTTDDWKIWIDEDEESPEYVEKDNVETEVIAESINPVSSGAVKTYVDTQLGNIETLLSNVADESEAI